MINQPQFPAQDTRYRCASNRIVRLFEEKKLRNYKRLKDDPRGGNLFYGPSARTAEM